MTCGERTALGAIVWLFLAGLIVVALNCPAPCRGEGDAQHHGQRREEQNQPNAVVNQQRKYTDGSNDQGSPDASPGWWALAVWATPALTAIFSLGIAIIVLRHDWAISRPWMIVTITADNVIGALARRQNPKFAIATITVTNCGSVPGWLTHDYQRIMVVRRPTPGEPPHSCRAIRKLMEPCPLFPVRPGPELPHSVEVAHRITDAEWDDILAQRASIVAFGFFRYRGVRSQLWSYPVAWFAWEWRLGPAPPESGYEGVMALTGPAEPRHWTRYT